MFSFRLDRSVSLKKLTFILELVFLERILLFCFLFGFDVK